MGYEGGTVDQILAKLKACLTRADQAPLLNGNTLFTATQFGGEDVKPPGTAFDRHVLDRLSADPSADPYGTGTTRPIRIAHQDAHKSYTNTKAIQNAGLNETTPPPPGSGFIGREPDNYPSGVFSDFSAAWGPAPPAVPNSAVIGARDSVALATSRGITTITQMLGSSAGAAGTRRSPTRVPGGERREHAQRRHTARQYESDVYPDVPHQLRDHPGMRTTGIPARTAPAC